MQIKRRNTLTILFSLTLILGAAASFAATRSHALEAAQDNSRVTSVIPTPLVNAAVRRSIPVVLLPGKPKVGTMIELRKCAACPPEAVRVVVTGDSSVTQLRCA